MKNRFSIYDSEEMSTLKLIEEIGKKYYDLEQINPIAEVNEARGGYNTLNERLVNMSTETYALSDRVNVLDSESLKAQSASTVTFLNTFRDEDCIFIKTTNNKNILIDCGEPFSQSGILNNIGRLGITQLDYLFITHFHSDHAGNIGQIIDIYKPKHIYYKKVNWAQLPPIEVEWGTEGYYQQMLNACRRNGLEATEVTGELTITLSPQENIKIFNPTFCNFTDYNSSSLMFLYNNCGINCLFPGDATTEVLENHIGKIPGLSLYKGAHHGGYDKNASARFIANTRPKITHLNGLGLPYSNETGNISKYECDGDVYIDGEYHRGGCGYVVTPSGVIPTANTSQVNYSETMFPYNNFWCICDSMGRLCSEGIVAHRGNLCYVNNWRYVTTPMWVSYNGYEYYIGNDGYLYRNRWKQSEDVNTPDRWYYLGSNGRMLRNETRYMEGKWITFDNNGIASTY